MNLIQVSYMNLERLYCEVKKYIDLVDFSKLWRGFEPLKFALYSDKECFFDGAYIEKTDAFLANTSIFYNGEWIAIWCVQEEMNPIVLTSKIIHEMFHGFQMMHNESRFFDDLDALYNYKYEEDNLNLKVKENRLLYHLTTQFDKEMFEELLQIRKYRFNTFRYAYHYESCIEQIEGTANYVELNCLKQLSSELFEKRFSAIKERVIDPSNLMPIRIICYDIGALLLYVMAVNNIAFDDGFSSLTFSEEIISDIEGKKYISEYSTKDLLDNFNSKANEIIRKSTEKQILVTDTPCDLLAVNVYDAIFYDNYIISRYFVMFGSMENQQIEYGDFVIETNAYKKVTRIYRI